MCGELVDPEGRYGVAIGLVVDGRREFCAFGPEFTDATRFEIGSITKVFTGLLLADMVADESVSLDEPVSALLPENVRVPAHGERAIRLLDLSSHTSGLPRLPDDLHTEDPGDPYGAFTVEHLYAFLGEHELRRIPGERYEYSNLGAGLLGHALARRAKSDYESLVIARICEPLGMVQTRITLTEEDRKALAPPFAANGEPASNWSIPTLAGAGALRSTVADLTTFVAACLEPPNERFARVLEASLTPRHRIAPHLEVALGWHVVRDDAVETVWHNGATGGYSSYLGFRPAENTGVVILCNRTRGGPGPDPAALGARILDGLRERPEAREPR